VKVYFDDVTDNKHVPEWWEDTTNPASATVLAVTSGAPLSGIDAALADQPPYLKGTVTDKESGAPLKDIEAWLYMNTPAGWTVQDYVRTDANGEYMFRGFAGGIASLPLGTYGAYKLRFFDPSETYATEYWDDQPTFAEGDEFFLGRIALPSAPLSEGGMNEVAPFEGPFIADAELALKVPRAAGPDRYDAAITTARELFPDWDELEHVIIAAGEDEAAADALAAAGLSWAYDAPVLLTSKNGPSQGLLNAISMMGPDVQVHVAGGPRSVPFAALKPILDLPNVKDSADRISGADRYSTAVAIAQRVDAIAAGGGRPADAVLVANGADWEKFFDALALSAPSAGTGLPIVLVQEDAIPAPTMAYLNTRAPSDIYVAGGPATVSKNVSDQLIATGAITQRWWGKDRYATAAAVAKGAVARGWLGYTQVGVAARVPDAMSGGAAVGRKGGPLLLTQTDMLPMATRDFLSMNKGSINSCLIFGGPKSVSEKVRDEISVVLK
jgi:putative cell wall-binding protein